ncbi:MAG: hypothetical protein ACI4SH_08230 [Candidatus Scatosoma sp.]
MDALTLLIVYLVTQNPEFKGNLAPLAEKLKESQDMLKFLNSLSSFPCSLNGKPCEPPPAQGASPGAAQNAATDGDFACNNEDGKNKTNKKDPPCNEGESPLRTVGGEWLEKYITRYLQK